MVDDDPRTLPFVRDALAQAGYAPLVTGDPREIPEIVRTERPCLVLLDLMLPGTDGIELVETVPELADQPVIFISAYGRDETVARALEKGADDYLVKPFSATELTARIQVALRKHAGPETFVLGDLAVHYDERRVTVGGRPVPLFHSLAPAETPGRRREAAHRLRHPPSREHRHGRDDQRREPGRRPRTPPPRPARRAAGPPRR